MSISSFVWFLHGCVFADALFMFPKLFVKLKQMLKNCSGKIKIGFVRYEQSSQCESMGDSSVSYASAAAKVVD